MRSAIAILCLIPLMAMSLGMPPQTATEESLRQELSSHATPLHLLGETLLLKQVLQHDYFLLGELHGEVEIPKLLADLWPSLWRDGYRHVAAEVSPWAAAHLRQSAADDPTPVPGLWNRAQAAAIGRFAPGKSVLWGCDIEEEQPDRLIRQLAVLNPDDARLESMLDLVADGYSPKHASELLHLAESGRPAHDAVVGGESMWTSLLDTLRVEALRANPGTRYAASDARERVMKELLISHSRQEPGGKLLLRFGRNHLHRGYDARGISTLGNFVSEWAIAQGKSVFNVGVFAGGGEEHLAGKTFTADERQDEPTFAMLAELAGENATIFDLRALRPMLHSIPSEARTTLEVNLAYWADSYDFLLCYPRVSPLLDSAGEAGQ
jgi:hypothetical protein